MDKKNLLKSPRITIEPSDEADLWNADWVISLTKGEKNRIGKASFAGEKVRGTVPLQVELEEEYQNQGCGTEAIRMMVNWAFRHANVYEVTAVAEHENDKAVKALGKAGFVYREGDRHTEQYSIVKGKSNWLGIYLVIGICLGLLLGIVLSAPKLGFGIGLIACLIAGAAMDNSEKHKREKIIGTKDE